MKILTFLLAFILTTTLTASAFGNQPGKHVHVISKKLNVFYFKVEKEFIGAVVEVTNDAGEKLILDTLFHRKALIDFFNGQAGHYRITVTKGDVSEQFDYEIKVSGAEETTSQPMVMVQDV